MTEYQTFVCALKRALRQKGITYAQVAVELDLSEATVKRLFSRGGFTLERFEQICTLATTTITAVARSVESADHTIQHLTTDQERTIVRNRKLLLVAICALNGLTLEHMVDLYTLSRPEAIGLLLQLDRMGLLKLLPENRIRLRAADTFAWLPDGPVLQLLRARIQTDYFRSHFDRPNESFEFVTTMLAEDTLPQFQEKLSRLLQEFSAAHACRDRSKRRELRPFTVVAAMRSWEIDEFRALRRTSRC